MQRREKLAIGHVADSGFLVRRDIGRHQRAERRLQRQPAGERLAAGLGVARSAIGEHRKISSALDALEILAVGAGCAGYGK